MDDARARAEDLAEERSRARADRDFVRADRLRDEIASLGFDVRDVPGGFELEIRPAFELVDPAQIQEAPVDLDASIHVLYEGHRPDLVRFLESAGAPTNAEVVVTVNSSGEGEWLASLQTTVVRLLHFDRALGWAESRNAAARASRGRVLIFADLSVEPLGDIVAPLLGALASPKTGICGPWGLVTKDLREFEESPGPVVDAVEGYVMALRREVFFEAGFDPWFRWYRHADLDLSFRVRAAGYEARVVEVPAVRHEHRGWASVPENERPARSRKNFNRFLEHWRDRSDLLVSGAGA